jgi:hypothetical protein
MHGGGEAEKWPTRLVTTSSRPADDCDVIGNNAAGYVVGPQGKKYVVVVLFATVSCKHLQEQMKCRKP